MPIQLNKTLQGTVYTFYITTEIALTLGSPETIHITQNFYQSKGHFTDGFLPIIQREVTITNQQRVNSIKLLLGQSYKEALDVAENFLVNNIAYYQGGVIENGVE